MKPLNSWFYWIGCLATACNMAINDRVTTSLKSSDRFFPSGLGQFGVLFALRLYHLRRIGVHELNLYPLRDLAIKGLLDNRGNNEGLESSYRCFLKEEHRIVSGLS